jgi:hypothetical protein
MAETIDEATIIAWVDGELNGVEAVRIADAVAADPALTALAERHRAMKARFAAAFAPLAQEPAVVAKSTPVISLAAVRAERKAATPQPTRRWWKIGGAIAASLLVGLMIGHGAGGTSGVADQPGALALSQPIARALDGQLSGDSGTVRVALSFKDQGGAFCRSFDATNLSGIACRNATGWQLRYAAPSTAQNADYRMAGGDTARAEVISAMISGAPFDRAGEMTARRAGWH